MEYSSYINNYADVLKDVTAIYNELLKIKKEKEHLSKQVSKIQT